ncbi:MAG: HNH endonuclease [Clostridia bacterium]|nr:HNH endonuclease [Clostridia bacterium]
MIIELPKKFSYSKDQYNYANVRNGKLIIRGSLDFEDLMYDLTYSIKGRNNCYYCGKTTKKITIDHMFPRDYGGISITNNLLPACSKCNSQKSNLNLYEYQIFRTLDKLQKEVFKGKVYAKNEKMRYKRGFNIPKSWIETVHISRIFVRVFFDQNLHKGKKYNKYTKFIKKYGRLPRPIILSGNFVLLDGFTILVCAREQGIHYIPVVVLENVEVI